MSRNIGKTRQRAAKILAEAFASAAVTVEPFDGSALVPVSGYWKSQDCWRWESVGLMRVNPVTGNKMGISVGSWDTLRSIVSAGGIDLVQEHIGSWEAHARAGDPA